MLPRDIQSYVSLVIRYAEKHGHELTNLKLQKVLYYLQAWSLAISNDDLFDDIPQAWVRGPVYEKVYHRFSHMKAEPIIEAKAKRTVSTLSVSPVVFLPGEVMEQEKVLEAILECYMPQEAEWLGNQTHREAPWIEARVGLEPTDWSNKPLSKESMKSYYANSANMHHPLNPFIPPTVSISKIDIQSPLDTIEKHWQDMQEHFQGVSKESVLQRAQELLTILRDLEPVSIITDLTYDQDLYIRAKLSNGRDLHCSTTFGEDSDPDEDTFFSMFIEKERIWAISCAFARASDTLDEQLNCRELVA